MLSRMDSRKKIGDKPGNGKLLNDIEAISKALYLDKAQPRILMSTASSRSKSVGKAHFPDPKSKSKENGRDLLGKDSNKKSMWSWKSLKSSLTQVKSRRFDCCFSLQVHCIEGLPALLDDLSLVVHWKRRDGELMTRPVMVCEGIVEFEEELSYTCSIYGSRTGPHHSAKYEAKHCLLYASVYGTPELDLGKHRLDLTRLLPLTLEELEDEKSSGKWTTSFRLSGKAKDAIMNVSFGYHIVGNGNTSVTLPSNRNILEGRDLRRNSASAEKILAQSEQSDELSIIRRAGSLPTQSSTSQQSAEDVKDLHEVLPAHNSDLCKSVEVLYQKLEEEKLEPSVDCKPVIHVASNTVENLKPELSLLPDPGKGNVENECEISEFSVIEQGIELPLKKLDGNEYDSMKAVDGHVAERSIPDISVKTPTEEEAQPELLAKCLYSKNEDLPVSHSNFETDESATELIMKELESALNSVSDLEKEGLESQEHDSEGIHHDSYLDAKVNYRALRKGKSLSLDYTTESVASDFLDMLGIEHSPFGPSSESEPDSPREQLLRQFEKETLASGCSLFNLDVDIEEFASDAPNGSQWGGISEDFGYSSAAPSYEEMPKIEFDASNKTGASMLEDLETEALMQEWGLNEKSFQYSPPKSSSGFGSPIHMPLEDLYQLPPLGQGLGPLIQTQDGGFLRSMNPEIFKNSKSGGSLIMQVSSPVVVPAEMGSGIMDILQHLASIGIEKLSMQASKLMPLEDITGKTVEQIAWENAPSLEGPERQDLLQHEFEFGQNMVSGRSKKGKLDGPTSSKLELSSTGTHMDAEYVSLDDLAPLAMDKIEALSIEGLRIQTGMSDEDAPSNISAQSIGKISAFKGHKVNLGGSVGLEGAGGLQLMDIKDNGDDVDGLMGLSLTLDEWMRLDSGEIDNEDEITERTSKLLAAHHASSFDLFRGRTKGEKRRGKGRKCGLLGNNFTVALMVQLRDPLRNYEPVGTPMLALVQVERVFVPPKPKIYSTVSEFRNSNEDDDGESKSPKKDSTVDSKEEKIPKVEQIPQYKITEVHVAGVKTEQAKKKLWGSTTQQQSGSRWLLANGMGKKNKHPLMKAKASKKSSMAAVSSTTTTVQPGDTLWSISSRVHGTGNKWKELAALNPHIRNPNVILPNETIRLR